LIWFLISEDLVSHVNPRNVVLCLLEIARIACTNHSFSPAPGLVQFEQEIDEIENVSETDGWSVSSLLQDSPVCYRDDETAASVGRIPSVSSLVSNDSSGANSSTNASTPTKVTSELDHKVRGKSVQMFLQVFRSILLFRVTARSLKQKILFFHRKHVTKTSFLLLLLLLHVNSI